LVTTMDDLRQRFETLDRVPAPDLWNEIERRLEGFGSATPAGSLVAVKPEWRGARAERPGRSSTRIRARRRFGLLVAAALIATLLVGGAFALGSALVRLTSIVPPSPEATPATSPGPSPAVASPSPSIPATPTPLNALPASPGMFAELRDYLPASDAVGWVATTSAIYRTTDTGITWTNVRSQGVTATSATALLDADTTYVASGGSPATIAATHDGGVSWVEATLEVGVVSGGPVFTFQAPMRGFATFYDPEGTGPLRVFATTDGGATWTGPTDGSVPHMAASFDKLNDPLGGFLWQRAGKFDNQPFDNRFFLSADGAASWTEYSFPTGPLAPKDALKEIVDIVQDDGGPITMAIMVNGGDGAVYEATADPATWRLVRTLPGPDVQLLSSTTWVVAATHAEFRSTVDAGEHWRTTSTPTRFREIPRFATPDDGWLIATCNPDSILPKDPLCNATTKGTMLLVTSDGGATWTRIID
jgi:photosystem II stability/assembly factor-like uncharacterized protein